MDDKSKCHNLGSEISAALAGAGFTQPGEHKLQYYFYFKEEAVAASLAARLSPDGFTCEVEKSADGNSWLCLAKKPSTIDIAALNDLGVKLTNFAAELGGEFDGWERVPDEGDRVPPALAMMSALKCYEEKKYAEAIVLFKQITESPSELGKLVWPQIGLAHCKLEQWTEAVDAFKRGLEHKPDDESTQTNLGAALSKLGKIKEAIALYQKVIAKNPKHGTAHYNLACAHARAGRTPDGLSSLKTAISLEKRFRELAKTEESFDSVRGTPEFESLLKGGVAGLLGKFGF